MEQFEKVCKGLECCRHLYPKYCDVCEYYDTDCTADLADDALVLIRHQQERIKELEAGPKWISVKDRLPEEDVDVLVANGMGIEIAAYTTNPVKQWYGMHGQDVYAKYWTPLPEPPKEGENDAR